jgi:hypothetical protein
MKHLKQYKNIEEFQSNVPSANPHLNVISIKQKMLYENL